MEEKALSQRRIITIFIYFAFLKTKTQLSVSIFESFYGVCFFCFFGSRVAEMFPRNQSQGFELDALEDIFRQKERDLEKGILNFTSRDKGEHKLTT